MTLNYGYLYSTKNVGHAFNKDQNFMEDKKAFESNPNFNVSRSLDYDGLPIHSAQILNHKHNEKDKHQPQRNDKNKDKTGWEQ